MQTTKRGRERPTIWVVTILLCLVPQVLWGQAPAPQNPCERAVASQRSARSLHLSQRLRRPRPPESTAPEAPTPPAAVPRFTPVEDRWRLLSRPNVLNPYRQNLLKGDVPVLGQHTFVVFTGISDTLFEIREIPVPSGVSTARPGSAAFFGRDNQIFVRQNVLLRFELLEGDTAFKPPDWLLVLTPALNVNYLDVQELGVVHPSVREGTTRTRTDVALQEAFFEYHLANLSPRYDFLSVKLGIQPFNSDFRGLLFQDTNLAGRLFGNAANNRYQYNLLAFDLLEKDTNSELNTFGRRRQQVVIANVYWQDTIWLGYTTQFSVHYNRDEATLKFDDNDFLVRPDPSGSFRPHELNVVYLGWTSNGHIGRLNITHAVYQALGHDDHNPLAGRRLDLNAQMVALELSMDFDWLRPKVSVFWTSGDADPEDGRGRGFDTIVDRPNFAGGGFSFWNRQGLRLLGVGLVQRESLVPNLRSSKFQGQVNFVNPGLLLTHAGLDIEVAPTLRTFLNVSYLRFVHTAPLELFLQQPDIGHDIGIDASFGVFYRPLLDTHVVITGGVAALFPGNGLKDLLTHDTLFQAFINLVLTY